MHCQIEIKRGNGVVWRLSPYANDVFYGEYYFPIFIKL